MATPAKRKCLEESSTLTAAVRIRDWHEVDAILKLGSVPDNQLKWAVEEGNKKAGDSDFCYYILPHCSHDQLESVLTTLVTRRMWFSIGEVLKRGVSDTQHKCAVKEGSTKADNDDFCGYILPYCSDDQLGSVLTTLVTRRMWQSVGDVLKRGVSDTQRKWAVEEGSKNADDSDFCCYILPHCSDDQLDVLTTLVTRRKWKSVGQLLHRGVSNAQNKWAVEEGSKTANHYDFRFYILPHCSDDQLCSVLTTLVTRRMWRSVSEVLKRGVSDTQRKWAVEEGSKKADSDLCYILPHCSDDQLESVLTTLVTRRMWQSVGDVLERGVSDTQRKWAVEEGSTKADDSDFCCYILSHCSDDQLESVLTTLVTRRIWKSVGQLLHRGVSTAQKKWAVEEGSKMADHYDFRFYILSHSSDDQLCSVLTTLVTRRMWRSVSEVLERGVSDTQHKWAVEEGIKNADDFDFCCHILSHCSDDQLESVLTTLVTRRMWTSVGQLLHRGVSTAQKKWAVEEGSKMANHYDFRFYILPHCSDDQLCSVLTTLVTRRMWRSVSEVLKRGVSDTQRKWAVEEGTKNADESDFCCYILPHCSDDQLESVLTTLVTRRTWGSVGEVLERGVSDTQRKWAVEEGSKTADDDKFCCYILPHCSDDQLGSVLTTLVTRRTWGSVGEVLKLDVSDTQHKWAVEEGSKTAKDLNFRLYILPHCPDDQLESVLKTLVTRRMCKSVSEVLKRGVSDAQRKWAVEEGSKNADESDFCRYILSHFSDDQLGYVLTTLVTRRMWRSVGEVLKRGVSDTQRIWAVEEGRKKADDKGFCCHILTHCSDDQLESVLTTLVTRRMWRSVGDVLKRGVSDTQRKWAVEEGIKKADDSDFCCHILSHCTDDQLESVLTTLVTRRMWQSIGEMMERGVVDAKIPWIFKEACKHANNTDLCSYILPFCADEMRLRLLIEQQLWRDLHHFLLQRNTYLPPGIALEACKKCSHADFVTSILPHCTSSHSEILLTYLVQHGKWEFVESVLQQKQTIIGDSKRKWAVTVLRQWNTNFLYHSSVFESSVILYCTASELEVELKTLVAAGIWDNVALILKTGVDPQLARMAVEETCKYDDCEHFIESILPVCKHYLADTKETLLMQLVKREKWEAVNEILSQWDVNDLYCSWTIEHALKKAGDQEIADYVLHHCPKDQLDSVFETLLTQGCWISIGKMLRNGVNHLKYSRAVEAAVQRCNDLQLVAILQHTTSDQLVSTLHILLERGLWHAVTHVIKRIQIDDELLSSTIMEASRRAEEECVYELLDVCPNNINDQVTSEMVTRGLWNGVTTMLKREISIDVKKRATEEACRRATESHLVNGILSYCTEDQADIVLETLVSRSMWKGVSTVLYKTEVTESKKTWAVDEAIKHASRTDVVTHILNHCNDEQLQTVHTLIVDDGQWELVDKVLKTTLKATHRDWLITQSVKKTTATEFSEWILPHCTSEDCHVHLAWMVKSEKWHHVEKVLPEVDKEKQQCAIDQIKQLKPEFLYESMVFELYVTGMPTETIIGELPYIVEHGYWEAAGKVLKLMAGSDEARSAILEAVEKADEFDLAEYILPLCPTDLLESVLATLVSRHFWRAVGLVLKEGVSDSHANVAVTEAMTHAHISDFVTYVFPHCLHNKLKTVLPFLVNNGQWEQVGEVLCRGGANEQNQWVIKEASKCADGFDFAEYILPHCENDMLESALENLVERKQWYAVGMALRRGLSDEIAKRVNKSALQQATDSDLVEFIVPYCATSQLELVLTGLMKRGLFEAVSRVLEIRVSDNKDRDDIRTACARKDWSTILMYITRHCDWSCVDAVLQAFESNCGTNDICSVRKGQGIYETMDHLAHEKHWSAVGELLQKSIRSESRHPKADYSQHFLARILPQISADQLEAVLREMVTRWLWEAAGGILHHTTDTELHNFTIIEASFASCEQDLITHIIPNCRSNEINKVMNVLASRDFLLAMGTLMKQNNPESNADRNDGSLILMSLADQKYFDALAIIWKYLLKSCRDVALSSQISQPIMHHDLSVNLGVVISHLVTGQQWDAVGVILKQSVSTPNFQALIQHVCKEAEDKEIVLHILPLCPNDFLRNILHQVLERGLWRSADTILNRGVDITLRKHVLEVASTQASDADFAQYIVRHCQGINVDNVLSTLLRRCAWKSCGLLLQLTEGERPTLDTDQWGPVHVLNQLIENQQWLAVDQVLCENVLSAQEKQTAIVKACNMIPTQENFSSFLLPHCDSDSAVEKLVENGCWTAVCYLLRLANNISHETRRLAIEEASRQADGSIFKKITECCRVGEVCQLLHRAELSCNLQEVHTFIEKLGWCKFFEQVILAVMNEKDKDRVIGNHLVLKDLETPQSSDVYQKLCEFSSMKLEANRNRLVKTIKSKLPLLTSINFKPSYNLGSFIKFITQFNAHRSNADNEVMLMIFLTLVPVFPDVQSILLRRMLRKKEWDIIKLADLTYVWEQVRRELLQAAVKQGKWDLVKQWADHRLYHDQQWWALEQTVEQGQWECHMVLADHGLTERELMRARFQVAKHGDWDTILDMLDHCADVTEVREFLEGAKGGRFRRSDPDIVNNNKARAEVLWRLERSLKENRQHEWIKEFCKRRRSKYSCNWRTILYKVIQARPLEQEKSDRILQKAIQQNAWNVVKYLARQELNETQRNTLFPRVVDAQQWGVCRELLDKGVKLSICLTALPTFMDLGQWFLVARMMEYDVGDSVRHDVLKRAVERREGSVVWHCISTMHKALSVEQRKTLFEQSFSRCVWQAVKPLIQVKDSMGIEQRDLTMEKAIEQHKWDVVDHCQRFHADINKHREYDDNPLLTAAKNKDWEAVDELVCREGDQSQLDNQGLSVLHRAIEAEQWNTVKLLIQYHGNLNLLDANSERTPIHMLIDERQGEIIDLALLWSPGLPKGINDRKETPLHAACASGWSEPMYFLVTRGVDPLGVTEDGESVLMYAVMNKTCPQKMLAECIRLGFSTRQPKITDAWCDPSAVIQRLQGWEAMTSPMEFAIVRNMPVICVMLYESGACSNTELFNLSNKLQFLQNSQIWNSGQRETESTAQKEQIAKYIRKIATTPRRLESTCRLVISHNFDWPRKRQTVVSILQNYKPRSSSVALLMPPPMADYISFNDLTDPKFGSQADFLDNILQKWYIPLRSRC